MPSVAQRIRFLLDHRWSPRHMSEYLDGDLAPAGRVRIERHLHDCHTCRELLRSLRAIVAGLQRPEAPVERSVAPAVLAQVRRGIREDEVDAGR